MAWIPCDVPPKGGETDFGSYTYSREVIIVNSRGERWIGFYQDWYTGSDEERKEWNCWKAKGSDSYTISDAVAWCELPVYIPALCILHNRKDG